MTAISRYTREMTDAWVAAGHWRPDLTIDYWARNAVSRPHSIALADDRGTYTWAEGMRALENIAAGLLTAGMPRDAVVLAQAPNSALFVLFRLACELAGILPAFLHTGFRRAEIEAVAAKTRPVGAVFAIGAKPDTLALYRELAPKLRLRHLFTLEPNADGIASLAGLSAVPAAVSFDDRRIRPYEMTSIVTSSGTTGQPKCVEYSGWARIASGRVYIERLKMTEHDIVMSCLPFYTGGGDMQYHTTPQIGARFIVLPQFSAEAACTWIERERVTGAVMVPTMIARIAGLANLGDFDLSTLRWVVSGGGMLPYDIGARFEEATGASIIQGYGLMDYGALSSHAVDQPREVRLRSSGLLMPGTQYRVLDESGVPVAAGSVGELCARGPHCHGGYIGDPEAQRRAWKDGYFHTGDLGRVSADGTVVLEGRSKDIIIRGGQNISAPEIELILCRHPAVADAALVRMPDAEMGERACAFIVLQPGASLPFPKLIEFMKSQEIATFKIPERMEVVSEFPMTAAGNKVDKRALEARLRRGTASTGT